MDVALSAVDELAPLIGAASFIAADPLVKARADLSALRFADGIHDSLYRSGGKTLVDDERPQNGTSTAPPLPTTCGPAAA